jgi:hypothetical protein
MAAGLPGWGLHAQDTASNGQGSIRWDHVDVVRRDQRLCRHLQHGHPGVPCQQRRQETLTVGGEVLDKHESHTAVRRHLREKRLEGRQAARGRPYTHNDTAPVRPPLRARRLGLRRSLWILGGLVVHSMFCLKKMHLYELWGPCPE